MEGFWDSPRTKRRNYNLFIECNKSVLVHYGLRQYFPLEISCHIESFISWYPKMMKKFRYRHIHHLEKLNKKYEEQLLKFNEEHEEQLLRLTLNESIDDWQRQIQSFYDRQPKII